MRAYTFSGYTSEVVIFQSTPPARGGDTTSAILTMPVPAFQSTPPARGATKRCSVLVTVKEFQSTPPARGATNAVGGHQLPASDFNPRPPRGGRLPQSLRKCSQRREFQSTPPARGATVQDVHAVDFKIFQSTPPARGATTLICQENNLTLISIHAPREGGDPAGDTEHRRRQHFNPRPPRGGRPRAPEQAWAIVDISIHAPREGGDTVFPTRGLFRVEFQSTPPARGATSAKAYTFISPNNFNPRPPRGGRHPAGV